MGLTFFKKTKISKLFLLKLAFMNIAKSPKKGWENDTDQTRLKTKILKKNVKKLSI